MQNVLGDSQSGTGKFFVYGDDYPSLSLEKLTLLQDTF